MINLEGKIRNIFKITKEWEIVEKNYFKHLLVMVLLALFILGIIFYFHEIKNDNKNKDHIDRLEYSEIFDKNEEKKKSASKDTYEGYFQGNVVSVNFNYSFAESEHFKIDSVYDDGEKTYISLNSLNFMANNILPMVPSIYIKEIGKTEAIPVNYKIYNNQQKFKTVYVIDKLAKEIELRYSDNESIKIGRKN